MADCYFKIEINKKESLQNIADVYFNVEMRIRNIVQALETVDIAARGDGWLGSVRVSCFLRDNIICLNMIYYYSIVYSIICMCIYIYIYNMI